MKTIELTSAREERAQPTWDSPRPNRDLIDQVALIDAIRPNPVALDDVGTREQEANLLSEPSSISDTAPPPPPETSDVQASGVRPIRRSPPPQPTVGPLDAPDDLRGPALARARLMTRGTAIVSVMGAVTLQFVDAGFDLPHVLATAATVAAFGTALWVEVVAIIYGSVSHRHHLALGVVATTALLVVLAHGGVMMPGALFALLVAHHYAGGGRRRDAITMTAFAVVGLLAIGALTGLGVLNPKGPFVTQPAAAFASAASLAAFIGMAAWLSWFRSRRLAEVARRGNVRVGRREALLDEAYATIETLRSAHLGHRTGKRLGRYHLHEVIGHSFRSDVYRAISDAGDHVAIKIFSPGLPQARIARLFSRATTASRVCPRAARVHEMGYLGSGGFFIAMEMLQENLATRLRAPDGVSVTDTLILVGEIASALARAHEARLYHGNIKPENILLDGAGRWRLTDFDTPAASLAHGVPAPRYTPPGSGADPSAAGDVFALAAVAYRMLLRCPAICETDPFATGMRRPLRPSAMSSLHPDVDAVFALALATDPRLRMSSPTEFATALRDAVDGVLPAWQRDRAQQILASDPLGEPYLVA